MVGTPATPHHDDRATAAKEPPAEAGLAVYHTTATASVKEHRHRTLKHGDTFAVFDQRGDIGGEAGNPEGLYHDDTRILSRFDLQLDGARPLFLSSTTQEDNAVFSADLTNPDRPANGDAPLERELIHINRLRFIWNGGLFERLLVRNFDEKPHSLVLTLQFAADFADLFEVRGQHRRRRGVSSARCEAKNKVALRYLGLDGIERVTALIFDPAPDRLDPASADFVLRLRPRETRRLFLRIGRPDGVVGSWGGQCFYHYMREARRALRRSSSRATAVESSNSLLNEMVRRSVSDLYMLITDTEEGPYPYAGIPWFSTPFGRDGIITALQVLWLDPEIAKGVLKFLAATQATERDPERDAEPGKILHEMRRGEMANLHEVPFGRYYGSVDATPLFVLLLGEYFQRTGDLATVRALWPHVEAALAWIDGDGDPDGDGFVEYARSSEKGLANQGWKDSQDAIFHADGRLATGPIALCEVQSYVYGAKHHAAALAERLGKTALAAHLKQEAEELRVKFEAAFWCEELSTYALALDGEKRPCRVIASNAGHTLLTGIAAPERACRVAATLAQPGSFSGWGVRTVAVSARRFNPMSYHNGSIWPHDNALIALGLARYGFKEAVLPIFAGMFEAASYMDLRRLPELFCGFARRQRNAPTLYPVACTPQAWASTAIMAFLQASLGLEFRHDAGEIRFDRPALPQFVEVLELHRLRLGEGMVDVRLRRRGEEVAVTVTERRGDVRVVVLH